MLILQGRPERERAHTPPISSQYTASMHFPSVTKLSPSPGSHPLCGDSTLQSPIIDEGERAGGGEGSSHWVTVRHGTLCLQPTGQNQSRDPDFSQQDWDLMEQMDTHLAVNIYISTTQDSKRTKSNSWIILTTSTSHLGIQDSG